LTSINQLPLLHYSKSLPTTASGSNPARKTHSSGPQNPFIRPTQTLCQ